MAYIKGESQGESTGHGRAPNRTEEGELGTAIISDSEKMEANNTKCNLNSYLFASMY